MSFNMYFMDEDNIEIWEENEKQEGKNINNCRKRNPFSREEDDRLLELINFYGKKNWKIIALHMDGRNVRQCRERFQFYLDEKTKNTERWSKEEDEILLSKFKELGPRWKLMEPFFVKRNMYSIKNRYKALTNIKKYPRNFEESRNALNIQSTNNDQHDTLNDTNEIDLFFNDSEMNDDDFQIDEFLNNSENDYYDGIY